MDLELVKKEIESRKKEKTHIAETSGIDMPMAKDNFLHSLQESLQTGRPNQATQKLKVVTDRSDNMDVSGGQVINNNKTPVNEQVLQSIQQPVQQPTNTHNPPQNANSSGLDPREEQFYKNLQETKQLLGNSNNVGMADTMSMYMKNQSEQAQMITNSNALNEAVQREVKSFMANIDFPKLVEDIVKSTMMEMYQKEKLESALNENHDKIEKMVVDAILKLKKRNTQKK